MNQEKARFMTDVAIEFLVSHDFTHDQATNILQAVCAKSPEDLMGAADRLIEYCAKASQVWGLVSCIADGYISVTYDGSGMMLGLTEKGVAAGAQLTSKDACLPEIPG